MPNNNVKMVPQIERYNSCNEIKMENNKDRRELPHVQNGGTYCRNVQIIIKNGIATIKKNKNKKSVTNG